MLYCKGEVLLKKVSTPLNVCPQLPFSLFKHLRVALTSRESIFLLASRNYPHVTIHMHVNFTCQWRSGFTWFNDGLMKQRSNRRLFFPPISKPHLTLGTPSGHFYIVVHVKAGSYERTPRRHVSQ